MAPIAAHVGALALLLVAIAAVLGTSSSWTSDEGATIHQVRAIESGSWLLPHPLAEADPTGVNYPISAADWGEKGIAPLARHPLYPALLVPFDRLGGEAGLIAVSLGGAVLASLLAAHLAALIHERYRRPTLWLVGTVSPVYFYSFIVVAHTLAAAVALGATSAVLGAAMRPSRRVVLLALAATLVALCAALRTEGIFLAPALVAALFACRRDFALSRRLCAAAAGLLVGAGGLALVADRAWLHHVIGAARADPTAAPATGGGAGG
jgi:hypothetical protein